MTPEDFAAKVEWEGGVLDALEYGLTAADLPEGDPLREAWEALEFAYKGLQPAISRAENLIDGLLND